jgi:hypothetical protein
VQRCYGDHLFTDQQVADDSCVESQWTRWRRSEGSWSCHRFVIACSLINSNNLSRSSANWQTEKSDSLSTKLKAIPEDPIKDKIYETFSETTSRQWIDHVPIEEQKMIPLVASVLLSLYMELHLLIVNTWMDSAGVKTKSVTAVVLSDSMLLITDITFQLSLLISGSSPWVSFLFNLQSCSYLKQESAVY